MSVSQKLLRSFNSSFKEVILGDLPYLFSRKFRIPLNDVRTFLQEYVDDQLGSHSNRGCTPYMLYQLDRRDTVKNELIDNGDIDSSDPPKKILSLTVKKIGSQWKQERDSCTSMFVKYVREAEKVNATRLNRDIPTNGTYLLFVKMRRHEVDPSDIHTMLSNSSIKELKDFARRYNILLDSETNRSKILSSIHDQLRSPDHYIQKIKRIQSRPIPKLDGEDFPNSGLYIENISDYHDPLSIRKKTKHFIKNMNTNHSTDNNANGVENTVNTLDNENDTVIPVKKTVKKVVKTLDNDNDNENDTVIPVKKTVKKVVKTLDNDNNTRNDNDPYNDQKDCKESC